MDRPEEQAQTQAQTQEPQTEHRCSFCPEEGAEVGTVPPQPENLAAAAMANLRCGHQVHTHCLLNNVIRVRLRYRNANDITCAQCDIPLVETNVIEYFQDLYERDDDERPRRNTVRNLWENSQEFRDDIKKYKKSITEYNKASRNFMKEAMVVKNRFLQNIETSVQLIKDQKRVATQEFNRIASKRLFRSKTAICSRIKNQLRAQYDIPTWEIADSLRQIEGAPKINRRAYFYQWRCSARWMFRIRL